MKFTVQKIKKPGKSIFKPKGRTRSRNNMEKKFFLSRLALLGMSRKDFVELMKKIGFPWTVATVYAICNNARVVSIEEAMAMCHLLGCEQTDLFPAFTAYDRIGSVSEPTPA